MTDIERILVHLDATHHRLDKLADAFLHLACHISRREAAMSATTDAIKADLAKLDAGVDAAIAHAADTAKDAVAAEEAELADIKSHIESIGEKVNGMVPAVVAAVAPAPSAPKLDTSDVHEDDAHA